jgi:ParB family transcriptional regulator, chromosome partitioning protein
MAMSDYHLDTVSVADIDEGIRFRKTYDALPGLIESIKDLGLLQPIAILRKDAVADWDEVKTHGEELDPDKPYLLLAGGRRFRAHVESQWPTIDAKVFTRYVKEDELREMELVENLQRENLQWAEEVALTKEIHEIRTRRYGKTLPGKTDKVT